MIRRVKAQSESVSFKRLHLRVQASSFSLIPPLSTHEKKHKTSVAICGAGAQSLHVSFIRKDFAAVPFPFFQRY